LPLKNVRREPQTLSGSRRIKSQAGGAILLHRPTDDPVIEFIIQLAARVPLGDPLVACAVHGADRFPVPIRKNIHPQRPLPSPVVQREARFFKADRFLQDHHRAYWVRFVVTYSAVKDADGKISFDKRGIIVKLSKIPMDREKVRKKEITMFSVSEKASEMIKEFLKSRSEAASIRVLMQEGG
jgi:hypothetical protein